MMMETVPSGTILHGRYRIERVLGSGGFGHVYLAIDLTSNRQFAIKEYFVTGTSGQAQLQHEARVLSQLHHPNLPAFHEAFNERGHYFVVLSYIEGTDLTDHIRIARQRNEVIPLPQVLGWILSVCDAVQFLHTQQPVVIHRDIKPDNIRIMPNGTAILVDLGNAKATADGARTLFFIRHQGTPGYAPQEQYPGGSGTDERSDVYALGGTLYFALIAHEPPSVSTRNQSIQQGLPDLPSLQEQLANNPPEENAEAQQGRQFRANIPRPAKPNRHIRHLAQLSKLPPELLKQLNNIISRAMAMRPRDRYQTVAEFSNDLRRVVAALSTASAPTSPPARPVDPNSTQPDLPLLYDAIQKAKESAAQGTQGTPDVAANPPVQSPKPVETAATVNTCARCGATLLPKAAFCPSCGTAVNNPSIKGPANTVMKEAGSPVSKAPVQHVSSSHDVSLDKTMVITPQSQVQSHIQSQAQVQTFKPSTNNHDAHTASTTPVAQVAPSPKVMQHAAVSTVPPASMVSPVATIPPVAPVNNQPDKTGGFTLDLRIVIMVAVALLLVVIAILIMLSISHTPHGHALYAHPLWLSFAALRVPYERYFPFGIASSSTLAFVGLRSCSPGTAPSTGLSQRVDGQ